MRDATRPVMVGGVGQLLCSFLRLHAWESCGCTGGWQWAHERRRCTRCGRHEHLSYGDGRA